jgi:hypothetical protein
MKLRAINCWLRRCIAASFVAKTAFVLLVALLLAHAVTAHVSTAADDVAAPEWHALQPKPYRVGIAPSHIAADPAPLFASPELWQQARRGFDFYKYYALQTAPPAWCPPIPVKPFAEFCRQQKLEIDVEFGSFVPDGSGQE